MSQNNGITGISKDNGMGGSATFFYVGHLEVDPLVNPQTLQWEVLGWVDKAHAPGGATPSGPCMVIPYTRHFSDLTNFAIGGSLYGQVYAYLMQTGQDFAGGSLA